jgi:hypothetical protein
MPLHDLRKKILEKLIKIGFKHEAANDCSNSFYRAEDHSKSPNKTPGQPDERDRKSGFEINLGGSNHK